MSTRTIGILVAVMYLCLLIQTGSLSAQDEAQLWVDYAAAFKDPAGFAKKRNLIQKHKAKINGMVSYQINSIANNIVAKNHEDTEFRRKLLEDLGRMYELVFRSNYLDCRIKFARDLNSDSAPVLVDAVAKWQKFIANHNKLEKSPEMVETMIMEGTSIVELFEEIREDFILGEVCELLSRYYGMKEDYKPMAEYLEKARKSFARHKRNTMENHVALKLRNLESKGYKVGKDGSVDAKGAEEERKVRPEPKLVGVVKTKYKKDKGPTKFESVNLGNYFDHMFWRELRINKEEKTNWPLGDGSVVTWEGGAKLFLDLDNTEKNLKRLKATGGAQKMADIPVRYAHGKGKYRLLLRGLGKEKYLGREVQYTVNKMFFLKFARACHLEGTFNGIKFCLIDDNVNGKYDDYGVDMIKIGKEPIRPVSKYMDFGGTLYLIDRVKQDGSEIHFKEYVGDTGKLLAKWNGPRGVKPEILVFQCTRGEFSGGFFNVAGEKPVTVPDGYYQFAYGIIKKGKGKKVTCVLMQNREGKGVFRVKKNEEKTVMMGAPFDVKVGIKSGGDGVVIPGKEIKIYGAMEEEYHHFYPESFKVAISVRVAGGGKILSNKKPGRPGKAEVDAGGMVLMWYPKDLDFKGNIDRTYEVKVDLIGTLLGKKIVGKWNEAKAVVDQ